MCTHNIMNALSDYCIVLKEGYIGYVKRRRNGELTTFLSALDLETSCPRIWLCLWLEEKASITIIAATTTTELKFGVVHSVI